MRREPDERKVKPNNNNNNNGAELAASQLDKLAIACRDYKTTPIGSLTCERLDSLKVKLSLPHRRRRRLRCFVMLRNSALQ